MDGGIGLQVCRAAAIILIYQSCLANEGCLCSFGGYCVVGHMDVN